MNIANLFPSFFRTTTFSAATACKSTARVQGIWLQVMHRELERSITSRGRQNINNKLRTAS